MEAINEMLSKYGWSMQGSTIINSRGRNVLNVSQKGKKYTIVDMFGQKLITGNNNLCNAIEKILTNYYYCSPINTI